MKSNIHRPKFGIFNFFCEISTCFDISHWLKRALTVLTRPNDPNGPCVITYICRCAASAIWVTRRLLLSERFSELFIDIIVKTQCYWQLGKAAAYLRNYDPANDITWQFARGQFHHALDWLYVPLYCYAVRGR